MLHVVDILQRKRLKNRKDRASEGDRRVTGLLACAKEGDEEKLAHGSQPFPCQHPHSRSDWTRTITITVTYMYVVDTA